MNNEFDYVNQANSNSPQPQNVPQRQYVTYIPYGFTPKTFEERRAIRKTANIIGGALLIMLAVSEVIVFLLRLAVSVFGYLGVKEINYLSSPAFLQYLQAILSILMFTLPFVFFFKLNGYRISSLVKFKKPKKQDFLPYLFLGVGVCFFANFAVNIAGQIFESFGVDYSVTPIENPTGFLGFMLTFIAIAVIPPLVEEFACRGIILGSLKKYGESFAIVCSAIIFGIMHGNFQQMPFAFLVGLVLGFIAIKTNTIWVSVAVHAVNNAISVLLDYVSRIANEAVLNVFSVILLTACLLATFIAVMLFKNGDDVYKLKKAKTEAGEKKKYKWFFTAPTIIIFIVICFIESLLFFK